MQQGMLFIFVNTVKKMCFTMVIMELKMSFAEDILS